MDKLQTDIKIISIKPFVFLSDEVLNELFRKNGKEKELIPVHVSRTINFRLRGKESLQKETL